MTILTTSLIAVLVTAWFLLHFVAYTMAAVPVKMERQLVRVTNSQKTTLIH